MKANINLKPVGKFMKEVCSVAVFGLIMSTPRILEVKVSGKRDNSAVSYSYSDAVEVIMSADMFASDKRRLVEVLKREGDDDYYKSVINIVKADMFASDKVRAVECLREK